MQENKTAMQTGYKIHPCRNFILTECKFQNCKYRHDEKIRKEYLENPHCSNFRKTGVMQIWNELYLFKVPQKLHILRKKWMQEEELSLLSWDRSKNRISEHSKSNARITEKSIKYANPFRWITLWIQKQIKNRRVH